MKFVRVEGGVFFCLRLINWLLFGFFGVWVQLDRLGLYRILGGICNETVDRVKFTVFSYRFFSGVG